MERAWQDSLVTIRRYANDGWKWRKRFTDDNTKTNEDCHLLKISSKIISATISQAKAETGKRECTVCCTVDSYCSEKCGNVGDVLHGTVASAHSNLPQDGRQAWIAFKMHTIMGVFPECIDQSQVVANKRLQIGYSTLNLLELLSLNISPATVIV